MVRRYVGPPEAGLHGALMRMLILGSRPPGCSSWPNFSMPTGSSELGALGGVGRHVPLPGRPFFFIIGVAFIGVPGTSGFPWEFLVLLDISTPIGRWRSAMRGVILNAAFFVSYYERAFLGPVNAMPFALSRTFARPKRSSRDGALVLGIGLFPCSILR